ncbi:hypothetical protein BC835DRAFT_1311198 [Cytidiella melzeri]|nr:hypothetical protein BC835DRAFT_1311198 [Cytidiella melzeri]
MILLITLAACVQSGLPGCQMRYPGETRLLKKPRIKGSSCTCGVDAEQFFASLTVVELQNATQTYWTSLHHKWLKDCKSAQEKEKLAGEARVKQRRVTKVKARIQNHDKVPEIAGPDYNWMSLAKYQSDEYSAAEDDSPTRGNNNRLSPDSDDPQASQAVAGRIQNTGSKKKPSSQPWVRRQPTYRTQECYVRIPTRTTIPTSVQD